ncbi:MAG TPA: aspartyl protease family protein [Arenibacter sp.]|nr:aspartyl protease family protein [Arenibacter sp.]
MKAFFKYSVFFIFCLPALLFSQNYTLTNGRKYAKIKFQLLNNLVIVPVEVNGAKLSFILDSGVSKPILFNLMDQDSIAINNVTEVTIRGLGEGEAIKALKSTNNIFEINGTRNTKQTLYVVLDEELNFSPRLGIPIHGIIGYDLYRDFVVSVNYSSKVLKLYDPEKYVPRRSARTHTLPIQIINRKAYLEGIVSMEDQQQIPVKLLVDSGSSDALWLFENLTKGLDVPDKNYEDFLGQGLNGKVYGKRTKIDGLSLGEFHLEGIKTAFPDIRYFGSIGSMGERNGSLGGEILKRFTTVFDYGKGTVSLRKNSMFNDPFDFNLSGIDLQHNGMRYISESIADARDVTSDEGNSYGNVQILFANRTRLSLVPEIIVSGIRAGSPGQEAGLQEGDVILAVNGKKVHNYELQQILKLLNEKEGKRIKVLVERFDNDVLVSYVLKEIFK